MDANIKTPQDALEWLECRIHEEAEADGEMTNEHAIQLVFLGNLRIPFCTIRKAYPPSKVEYYKSKIGEQFEVMVKPVSGNDAEKAKTNKENNK